MNKWDRVEKKKKKEPISNDTINKPTRRTKEKKLS